MGLLRSCPEGNNPLEFIFGDLVDRLSPMEIDVLCTLTHFALRVKLEPIDEIVGYATAQTVHGTQPASPAKAPPSITSAKTSQALRTLASSSLVVPSDEFKTFTLVPMVADFMRKKRPETVAEMGGRLATRACAIITENGGDKHDRFETLEAAWPSVAAALPLFLEGPNERLQLMCHELATFLYFSGRWDERLSLSEKAEAQAVMAGDHYLGG